MAATKLPDGSVVVRPSGQRAYPVGGGTSITKPAQAKGGGSGASGKPTTVNGSTKQPGRGSVGRNAYK